MPSTQQYLYRLHLIRPAILTEGPTDQEASAIGRHFAYLKEMAQKGVTILAGRTLTTDEDTFGIVIFRAASEEEAQRIMQEDPAVSEGVMTARLYPYRIALLAPENAE